MGWGAAIRSGSGHSPAPLCQAVVGSAAVSEKRDPIWRRILCPWVLWRSGSGEDQEVLLWRRRLPLVLIVALLVLEVLFSSRVWVTLLLAFGAILAMAAIWAWQMASGIRVHRQLRYPLVQVGDLLEEQFWLVNESLLPALWIEVVDHSDMPGYDASTVRAVGAQGIYRWTGSDLCRRRGEFRLGPWEAVTRDPFGIFAVVQSHRSVERVLVYPPIAQRLPFSLPRGATAGLAHVSQRSWEPTVTIGGVRAYVPGDPRHHIHWPTTARRAQLFAKEFDQETGGDVWIVLDLNRDVQVGSDARSTEEMAVIVAGSAAALMLDARRAVGLVAYGIERHLELPGRGRAHLWKLLRVLAKARAEESRPLANVLEEMSRVLPPGSTALVVTPSVDATWASELVRLRGRGIGASVVLLDAPSFAVRAEAPEQLDLAEATVIRRRSGPAEQLRGLLADVRVDVEIVDADAPLVLRPPTGQARRWEFKVLATGRAIAVSSPLERAA